MKAKTKRKELPLFHVILINEQQPTDKLIQALVHISMLEVGKAKEIADLSTKAGEAIILTTHKERAELIQQQFHYLSPPIQTKLLEA